MSSIENESLRKALVEVTSQLPKTHWKRMFGCDAVFADSTIFGLIWKAGRIGIKLPDEAEFGSLMSMKGSAPWKAGKMSMSQWVLVPEEFHSDKRKLGAWAKKAHRLAVLNPKLKKKPKK